MVDKFDDRDSAQAEEGMIDEGHDYAEQGDGWQDGQTPVDDFGDPSATVEATEEEIVEGDEVMGEEEGGEEAAPKRNAMWMPIAAAVFGVLFVGTMAYMQYSSETSGSNSTAMPVSEVFKQAEATGAAMQPEATATTNSSTDLSSIYTSQNQTTSGAVGTAVATTEKLVESEPLTTTASLVEAPAPQPAPVPVAQPAPQPVPAPVPAPQPVSIAAPVAPPASATTDAAADAKIAALMAQVDSLQKALETTTQQLTQLSSAVTNIQAAGSPAVATTVSPEMTERLAKLEQQITTMAVNAPKAESKKAAKVDASPAPVVAAPVAMPAQVSADETAADVLAAATGASEEIAAPKVEKAKKAVKTEKKKSVKSAKAERSSKKSKTVEAKTTAKSGWVLRAATPDTAWVAKSADAEELRQVEIGQSVPGIGKVKAIYQTAHGWEVVGTTGTIR